MEAIVDTFAFLNIVKITAKIGVHLYTAPWHEDGNIYFHFFSANKFVPLWRLAGNVLCKFCLVAAWRFDPSIMWRPPAGTWDLGCWPTVSHKTWSPWVGLLLTLTLQLPRFLMVKLWQRSILSRYYIIMCGPRYIIPCILCTVSVNAFYCHVPGHFTIK